MTDFDGKLDRASRAAGKAMRWLWAAAIIGSVFGILWAAYELAAQVPNG